MFRNYCGQKTDKMSIITKRVTFIILLVILIIMYAMAFNGVSTIVLFICAVFNLIGVILCNEQGIRLFGLCGSIFYTIFKFIINNYIGALCEIICAIVLISSYLIYKNKKN